MIVIEVHQIFHAAKYRYSGSGERCDFIQISSTIFLDNYSEYRVNNITNNLYALCTVQVS